MTVPPNDHQDAIFRPVGDTAVLVEFGNHIDDQIHQRVLQLDASVSKAGIDGVTETIPAYTSLLVGYDPLITDYVSVVAQLERRLGRGAPSSRQARRWEIPTCYSAEYAPDLDTLADTLGMTRERIIEAHSSAVYKVYLYGFAPGYAYLGGTPECIQVPRKHSPVNNVPTGSVMIAGPQSLITTVQMPSGWWVIGRTQMTPLQADSDRPFLFEIGDEILFVPISKVAFQAQDTALQGAP